MEDSFFKKDKIPDATKFDPAYMTTPYDVLDARRLRRLRFVQSESIKWLSLRTHDQWLLRDGSRPPQPDAIDEDARPS